jgi:hypothetical protein
MSCLDDGIGSRIVDGGSAGRLYRLSRGRFPTSVGLFIHVHGCRLVRFRLVGNGDLPM